MNNTESVMYAGCPCCTDVKIGSMDARSEWTMPRTIDLAQAHEAAGKLKEAVTQDSEAAEVVGLVEGLAEEDTAPKTSSSIHKAVVLVVSRAAERTSDHKVRNEIESNV